jgi:Na+-translocating ferredoxin:NAD+ oxidoreductase RNF subunit RnfB
LHKRGIKLNKTTSAPLEQRRQKIRNLFEFCPSKKVTGTNDEKPIVLMDLLNGREICIPLCILRDILFISKDAHKKFTINENLCKHLLQKNRIENFYNNVINKEIK